MGRWRARSGDRFARAVPLAVPGVTMVLVSFGAGVLTIGDAWFLMWQSTTWSGADAASRYFTVAGLTLIILLAANGNEAPAP